MNYKLTEPLQSQSQHPQIVGEFKTQKGKIRVLHGYTNQIIVANKKKLISLSFETKFSLLREPVDEKFKVGKPLGLLIERENIQHKITLFSNDVQMIKNWRDYLAKHINQRGFHESFKAHRKIGKGNFASVYLADRLEDERSFAIKAFSKEVAYGQDKGKMSILNEIAIMRQLDSYALIKLHEVYETDNSLYMVLDLLEGGSLYDKVKNRPQFNAFEIEVLIFSLLEGLHHMHSKNIMHRDLKPENILFRKQGIIQSVCIADFGLAQRSDEYPYLFNRCGTPGFVAPEVINCKDGGRYDPICDVFSLGLIFYILLTGKPAFPGKSYNDVLGKNRKCEISFDASLFENVPQQAYDLLMKLLDKNPKTRISAQQALNHGYFGRRLKQIDENEDNALRNQEEQLKFDKQRLKQLNNSPLHSPLIAASSKLRKDSSNDSLYQQSPLLSGRTDQIDSPLINSFNSPSAQGRQLNRNEQQQQKPSRFSNNDGNNTLNEGNSKGNSTQAKSFSLNQNPLHKYAIRNEMARQQNQQEQKQ
ncbi:unnamed protein product [Paramecium pentaurelia]|uniref:Protein kinase domain-containing protein n=1 Tax=Paramecium pentaurelia TaxID=43138 RepID=A0A8S1SD62_9CILI|nr:unnamed protein product [Paramecium pentaurelia]